MKNILILTILFLFYNFSIAGTPFGDSLIVKGIVSNITTGTDSLFIILAYDSKMEMPPFKTLINKDGSFEYKIHSKYLKENLLYSFENKSTYYPRIRKPIQYDLGLLVFEKSKHTWTMTCPNF